MESSVFVSKLARRSGAWPPVLFPGRAFASFSDAAPYAGARKAPGGCPKTPLQHNRVASGRPPTGVRATHPSTGVTLIAGNGVLPALFARGARRRGLRVCMVAHEGETEARSEGEADSVCRIKVGRVGVLFRALQAFGNREVAFVGGIRKTRLFADVKPDFAALKLLKKARDMRDDSLLCVLAAEIESRGFLVIGCTAYVPELLAADGQMGKRRPSARQVADSRLGFDLLSALSGYDTGQSVVLRNGVVLAIEAVEGTDAAIERAGRLGARGGSLVKAAKKGQDLRFDVPAIGPRTVQMCAAAGVGTIFLRAGETMLLGLEETIGEADRAGISICGVRP